MSTTAIKWLALVLMLVDHLGEFFPQSVPLWFRWLGRMSAPLFLFCLAQGLEKTQQPSAIYPPAVAWVRCDGIGKLCAGTYFSKGAGPLKQQYPLHHGGDCSDCLAVREL